MIIRHFFGNLSWSGVLVNTLMNNFDSSYSVMNWLSLIWIIRGSTCSKEDLFGLFDPEAFFLIFFIAFFASFYMTFPAWVVIETQLGELGWRWCNDGRCRIYIMNFMSMQWLFRYEVCICLHVLILLLWF